MCRFAHGIYEMRLHPDLYRTELCKERGHCSRNVCFFAHDDRELRRSMHLFIRREQVAAEAGPIELNPAMLLGFDAARRSGAAMGLAGARLRA